MELVPAFACVVVFESVVLVVCPSAIQTQARVSHNERTPPHTHTRTCTMSNRHF